MVLVILYGGKKGKKVSRDKVDHVYLVKQPNSCNKNFLFLSFNLMFNDTNILCPGVYIFVQDVCGLFIYLN